MDPVRTMAKDLQILESEASSIDLLLILSKRGSPAHLLAPLRLAYCSLVLRLTKYRRARNCSLGLAEVCHLFYKIRHDRSVLCSRSWTRLALFCGTASPGVPHRFVSLTFSFLQLDTF